MTEERIAVDTFDLNRSVGAVEEAVGRYSAGQETGRLMRATRPNPGAKITLVDATPGDGNVEIDLCKLNPFGWRIRITAIKHPTARHAEGPTVAAHAMGIASAIKHMDWIPAKPDRYAPINEWCEYRYQMESRGQFIPYREMATDSKYKPSYFKKKYNEYVDDKGNER